MTQGRLEVVCDLEAHGPRVVRRIRWFGGGREAFSFVAKGESLAADDLARSAGYAGETRQRWDFTCSACGDRVEARSEKRLGQAIQRLAENGVSRISMKALRAIVS